MLNEIRPVVSGLEAADRSFQREKGRSFLLRAFPYFLGLIILCFLLDVFFQLTPWPRIILLGVLGLLFLGVLGWSFYVERMQRNQLERIARLLETRDPALGSKLINVLQLQAQTNDPALGEMTRQIARQAIGGYADELRTVDFHGLAKSGLLARDLKWAGLAGLAFVIVLGVFYSISGIEIMRFADPMGDHPPYSFTQLAIVEPGNAGAHVVYNKNFVVKVKHSGHRPHELFLTYHPPQHPEQAVTVPMFDKGSVGFHQEIAGIKTDLIVFAHTKNQHSISKQKRLELILTPKLERAMVQIAPPAYTGIKAEEKPFDFKNVKALSGSKVQFRLQSNRPLRDGTLEIIKSGTEIQRVAMGKTGDNEVAANFDARDSARLRFSMVDADGIPSEDNWEGSLTVTHDLPPEIQIVNPNKDCFVAFNFKTEAQIEANDDYGLKMVRIHRALNQIYSPPKVVSYDKIVRNSRESLLFDFSDLGIKPGDVISMFAEAIDTAPEANLARSQTINLTVIAEEDYNSFLREQNDISDIEGKYSEMLSQLQDLIEEQKNLGEKIDALKQKLAKADPKQKAALQQELDSLLAKQNEVNQKLAKSADHMDEFVRKQPLYDVEVEFQKVLKQKAQDIRDSVSANSKSAQDIAQRSSPPSGQRQMSPEMLSDFKKASDEQLAKLGAVEEQTEKEVVKTIQDMSQMQEILKDFNRFGDLYQQQQALTEQTRAYNRSGTLSREDQLALKSLAANEKEVAEQLNELEDKLREDSKNAEKKFPKASKSAKDLANKMENARMNPLAQQATDMMLAAKGENSFQLSDRLRAEMEKLYGECKAQGGQQGEEMDNYMKLTKGMNPGKSFSQMMQSHKFGNGKGPGQAQGMGKGSSGTSGYAVMEGPSMGVLGNESFVSKGEAKSGGNGKGQEKPKPGSENVAFDKPDVMKGVKPVNRKSEAVTSESTVEEYSDIVDQYFKAITK
ncbi:MAG: hypothetical protein JWQ71_4949 [Pedosphaera sp.]|nr:hypothetical protein [Pedosphaera sp.]